MILQILVALLVLFVTWVFYKYFEAKRYVSNIPAPPLYPLILHDYILWKYKSDRYQMLSDLFQKYGPTFALVNYAQKTVNTIDPENIKYITSKNSNFKNYKRKIVSINQFVRLLGKGIFASDDEIWEVQRELSQPIFKRDSIKTMVPIFVKKIQKLLHLLDTVQSDVPIDIQKLFLEFTFDAFGEIGFGSQFEAMGSNLTFLKDFDRTQYLAILFLNKINQYYYQTEFNETSQRLDNYIYQVIQKKKEDKDISNKTDLLSQFMNLRDTEGKPYPDKWVRDIVFNFMIAGRDTTATLLTWTCFFLAKYPLVLQKLVDEIKTLNEDEPLTDTNIYKLTYLDCVIKESLRLRSPVPGVSRGNVEDDILPDGCKIKAGTRIRYWSYLLHLDPKYWKDPETFYPERWNNPKDTIIHSYQYTPFHTGPMSCLGKKMAELEAKTVLILILRKFRLEIVPNHEYKPFLGITTSVIGGCPVFVKKV